MEITTSNIRDKLDEASQYYGTMVHDSSSAKRYMTLFLNARKQLEAFYREGLGSASSLKATANKMAKELQLHVEDKYRYKQKTWDYYRDIEAVRWLGSAANGVFETFNLSDQLMRKGKKFKSIIEVEEYLEENPELTREDVLNLACLVNDRTEKDYELKDLLRVTGDVSGYAKASFKDKQLELHNEFYSLVKLLDERYPSEYLSYYTYKYSNLYPRYCGHVQPFIDDIVNSGNTIDEKDHTRIIRHIAEKYIEHKANGCKYPVKLRALIDLHKINIDKVFEKLGNEGVCADVYNGMIPYMDGQIYTEFYTVSSIGECQEVMEELTDDAIFIC